MMIDMHTHIWSSMDQLGDELAGRLRARRAQHWGQLDGSREAHEAAMTCVSGSVVVGFRSAMLGAEVPNEYIADYVARSPGRRIGFGGVDPMMKDAVAQVDRAASLGLAGVAVAPPCQGFHPTHSDAMRVYERCAELELPIFVLQQEPMPRSAIMEFGHPGAWDEVARALPELRIVISDLGYPWMDELFVLLSKHERVYATLSAVCSRPWQLYGALLSASNLGVMQKLFFGSGYPFNTPEKAIEALYTVNSACHGTQLPTISRASVREIVERDSLAVLGVVNDFADTAPLIETPEELYREELRSVSGHGADDGPGGRDS